MGYKGYLKTKNSNDKEHCLNLKKYYSREKLYTCSLLQKIIKTIKKLWLKIRERGITVSNDINNFFINIAGDNNVS